MKKTLFCVLTFLTTVFSVYTHTAGAAQYARLTGDCYAKVTRVIDGDSITVETPDGQTALVRLLGIDAKGYEDSVKYLNNTVLGNTVYLQFDPAMPKYVSVRWNNMSVVYDYVHINERLVSLGFAKVLHDYAFRDKPAYAESEAEAIARKRGLWNNDPKYQNQYPYSVFGAFYNPTSPYNPEDAAVMGSGLNINTALFDCLFSQMSDVPPEVINNIIVCRAAKPYSTIYDIKFVPGFTETFFNKYRARLTVCTNLTRATDNELVSLGSITQGEIAAILDYRKKRAIVSVSDLIDNRLVSPVVYEQIQNFVSIGDKFYIDFAVPNKRVYINTATTDELIGAGVGPYAAAAITAGRQDGYTYKTLGELAYLPGLYLPYRDIYGLSDNLLLDSGESYVNVNLASYDDLISAGFSPGDANTLIYFRGGMFSAFNIPVGNISNFNSKISLFTNINRAGRNELLSLGLSPEAVEKILSYRAAQPFGSVEELERLLAPLNAGTYRGYDAVRDFLTVL